MFRRYNANPLNNDTADCTVRAISLAEGKTWDETYEEIKKQVINPEEQVLYISHSNAIDAAIEFGELCKEEL